ncbi:MAG: amidohydrolase family protein [Planctomycetota bacterium]
MIVDIHTAVGRWPFSAAQSLTPLRLGSLLARAGVDLALTSSLEAVFHEDPAEDNRRLFRQLRGHKRLLPVPVINPRLADWRAAVAEWAQRAVAVKILPSYHACSLASGAGSLGAGVDGLAEELAGRRRPLLVQMRMEDERVQAPALRVPAVPVADIVALAKRHPRLDIVALGAYRLEAGDLLRQTARVRVDVSFLDGLDVVAVLVKKHRAFAQRLLLGSHAPLFYAQASVLKVLTAETTEAVRRAILGGNAAQMLGL